MKHQKEWTYRMTSETPLDILYSFFQGRWWRDRACVFKLAVMPWSPGTPEPQKQRAVGLSALGEVCISGSRVPSVLAPIPLGLFTITQVPSSHFTSCLWCRPKLQVLQTDQSFCALSNGALKFLFNLYLRRGCLGKNREAGWLMAALNVPSVTLQNSALALYQLLMTNVISCNKTSPN